MELANLLSYDACEALVAWFMREYAREPSLVYQRICVNKEMFVCLTVKTHDGLSLAADGKLGLDKALKGDPWGPRIVMLLNLLQKGSGGGGGQNI